MVTCIRAPVTVIETFILYIERLPMGDDIVAALVSSDRTCAWKFKQEI